MYRSTRKAKSYHTKTVFGLEVYFSSKNISKGRTQYLYVISNKLEPLAALEAYKARWSIEVLFGHLKKKGFNLESTHLREKKKLNKLLAVLALAFLFSIGWGLLLKQTSSLNAHQKRKSTFRLAIDLLCSMFEKPLRYKDKILLFHRWVKSEVEPTIFVV